MSNDVLKALELLQDSRHFREAGLTQEFAEAFAKNCETKWHLLPETTLKKIQVQFQDQAMNLSYLQSGSKHNQAAVEGMVLWLKGLNVLLASLQEKSPEVTSQA